ncbi:hypothetical protein [Brevibacterium sp. RIT 803]|nr:hypothetical protein [Brevibacterium sp. RIT 803]
MHGHAVENNVLEAADDEDAGIESVAGDDVGEGAFAAASWG